MYAIATLLDPNSDSQIRDFWQLLETDCGLAGIKTTPLPHFSWQGAENYPVSEVERILKDVAGQQSPFTVQTSGLGLFTSPVPVLYLALVKTVILMNVHGLLWDMIGPLASDLNSHYSPDLWMPHITVAYHDLTSDNLACAVKNLIYRPVELEIHVDRLALLYQINGDTGIKSFFPFKGKDALKTI
jgi:2'-5' RNA ligase